MTNFIVGLLFTLYGGGILIKSFIVHPTILDKIHVYGFTSYNAGTFLGALFGLVMLYIGVKMLLKSSKAKKSLSKISQESVE